MSNALVKRYTGNYNFKIISYDFPRWHNAEWDNWDALDAVLTTTGAATVSGTWTNATAYVEGERIVDTDQGTVWSCLVDHTSAATGTFVEDRVANPTYWTLFSSLPNHRGAWTTATLYMIGDIVYTGAYVYSFCIEAHTSSALFATDAGKWSTIFDTTATTAANAASAAASAASAASASGSATTATTKAGEAAASATTASTGATTATTKAGEASTSASDAATSATTATTQAGIATTQAGISTAQAVIATTKATDASNSQIAAATSANEAQFWAGEAAGAGGVPEAPSDGSSYARRGSDNSWQSLTTPDAGDIVFAPVGGIGAADVQGAIAELESEKVAKSGDTLTGALLEANGNAGSPSYSFSGDPNTGMYQTGTADTLGFSTNGVVRFTLDTAVASFGLIIQGADGTNALPAFSFLMDPNTGMYRVGVDTVGITTNGTLRFSVSPTSVTTTLAITLPGDPSSALQAAPKQYIDAKITNKITVASSAPGSPATNDLWVDTT